MHRQEILGSVGELRMFEGAKSFLLDLLHLICEKYPPNAMFPLMDMSWLMSLAAATKPTLFPRWVSSLFLSTDVLAMFL